MKGDVLMNTTISLIILVAIGILCAFLHKNKGYSPIAGFCWGFFFSIIGLLIILFERNKEEQIEADKNGRSMGQWLLIFVGIGILSMVMFFILANLM